MLLLFQAFHLGQCRGVQIVYRLVIEVSITQERR